jgi:hypothetical protein
VILNGTFQALKGTKSSREGIQDITAKGECPRVVLVDEMIDLASGLVINPGV